MNNLLHNYHQQHQSSYIWGETLNSGVAVIVETRPSERSILEQTIRNIRHYTQWEIIVYGIEVGLPVVHLGSVNINNHHHYNDLLKSFTFWEQLPHENILIFQTDSILLRCGITDYLDYGYVGAPWSWAYDPNFKDSRYPDLSIFKLGGNGGLSLRKKSLMLNILHDNYQHPSVIDKYLSEDMFFSKYLTLDEVPNFENRKRFCVETMFHSQPLGVHSPEKYLSQSQVNKILNK